MVRHGHCECIGEHSCESFVDRVNSPTATNMMSVCPPNFLLAPMTPSKEKRAGCRGFKEVRCYKDGLALQKLVAAKLRGCVPSRVPPGRLQASSPYECKKSDFGLSMDAADIERDRPEGFPAVAAWMARDPDNETFNTGSSIN